MMRGCRARRQVAIPIPISWGKRAVPGQIRGGHKSQTWEGAFLLSAAGAWRADAVGSTPSAAQDAARPARGTALHLLPPVISFKTAKPVVKWTAKVRPVAVSGIDRYGRSSIEDQIGNRRYGMSNRGDKRRRLRGRWFGARSAPGLIVRPKTGVSGAVRGASASDRQLRSPARHRTATGWRYCRQRLRVSATSTSILAALSALRRLLRSATISVAIIRGTGA